APTSEMVTITTQAGSSFTPPYPDAPACPAAALPPATPAVNQPVIDPSTQRTAQTRIRVGGFVQQARLVAQTKPIYPNEAKSTGVQGAVVMEIIIGRNGQVIDHKLISGNPILADSAWQAASRWCYSPTLLNGEPVEVVATVTVNYVLQ